MTEVGWEGVGISSGTHDPDDHAFCGVEYLRWAHGLDWSDARPECVCPILHSLIISASDDDRTSTVERAYGGRLMKACDAAWGSYDPDENSRRMFRTVDWSVRTVAPFALDATGLCDEANKLRALTEIVDVATAHAGSLAVESAAKAAKSAKGAAKWAAKSAKWAAAAAKWAAEWAAECVDCPRTIDLLCELVGVE